MQSCIKLALQKIRLKMRNQQLSLILIAAATTAAAAFQSGGTYRRSPCTSLRAEEWNGEVVNNVDGRIRGCTITPVSETEFTIQVDGNEADLGNFGVAVYKKITSDAKRQNFVGFRPGTIPPHLLPTYRAFAMDEVAREATLEAMQQNNIRPFESARSDFEFVSVSIPPKPQKKKKGKKKSKVEVVVEEQEEPAWQTFDNMKDALKGGWEPGQSFSFVATKCKGQKLKDVNMDASESLASLKNN
jgi:hypothetical protein